LFPQSAPRIDPDESHNSPSRYLGGRKRARDAGGEGPGRDKSTGGEGPSGDNTGGEGTRRGGNTGGEGERSGWEPDTGGERRRRDAEIPVGRDRVLGVGSHGGERCGDKSHRPL